MEHVYRVVLKVSYVQVHFDFNCADDAVRFCSNALRHMTDREDGKECTMVIKKINVQQELEEEAKESEEE